MDKCEYAKKVGDTIECSIYKRVCFLNSPDFNLCNEFYNTGDVISNEDDFGEAMEDIDVEVDIEDTIEDEEYDEEEELEDED